MSVSKWEMKIIPRSTVKEVYASIEADFYASENLAALPHKGKSNKRLHWHFRAGIYIKTTLRQLL
jgi:hypothetical protein